MRAGACSVQQTLSPEAASVLKHSLLLARRQGHAQLTPLHVAATLLTSPSTFSAPIRRACLKSSSPSSPHNINHHLQCRALELGFKVALNRLAAISPSAVPHLLHAPPSLSNALIAALKRAQAQQKRSARCPEQQSLQHQNFFLRFRVELDHLILSILDDPSVSRVMREAGFSSTLVKTNLEDDSEKNPVHSGFRHKATNSSVSFLHLNLPICPSGENPYFLSPPQETSLTSTPVKTHLDDDSEKNPIPSVSRHETTNSGISFRHSNLPIYPSGQYPSSLSPPQETSGFSNEDVGMVFDVFLGNKKRNNVVLVGDSLSMAEGVAAEVIVKFQKGDVPNELKSVKLITLRFSTARSLGLMKKHELDTNLCDLKRKVDSFGLNGRVIVYVGDLKWAVDRDCGGRGRGRGDDDEKEEFRAVDYLITEIGKLVSWYNCMSSSSMRVWLMATADYGTYMKKNCVLDVQWGLHAVFVPSGGLGLSLNATR
ncbi:hypothetical protein OROGR_018615 [Orobanche gracilis]